MKTCEWKRLIVQEFGVSSKVAQSMIYAMHQVCKRKAGWRNWHEYQKRVKREIKEG